jgi:molybdopterin/thiamine biosynthesis adenylyltransferase
MITSLDKQRFSRQILLSELGTSGQERLRKAKIFFLGSGGLASSAAYYLAAAGIGKIGIADNDRVDISNLNRQILHNTSRIGRLKVESAQETLQMLYPDLVIKTYPYRFNTSEELMEVLAEYDLLIDCTDNYVTRYLINDACIRLGKPWVYGAVFGFEGQIMTILPGESPCYRCLYPSMPENTKSTVPVMGVSPGMIGILQATEAIKNILNIGKHLLGKLLFVDLLEMRFSEFSISRNSGCIACGKILQGAKNCM